MKMRRFKPVPTGPDRSTVELIARTIARLRRQDIRALAIVLVDVNGDVSTAFSGHRSGQHHRLASGIADLSHRFHSDRA
jgi:hypothetical protein